MMSNKTEKAFSVSFTLTEGNELVNLLNLAVKAAGLEVAANALFFTDKLQKAFKSAADSNSSETPVKLLDLSEQ